MEYQPLHLTNENVLNEYRSYVDPLRLFLSYFKHLPSSMHSNHVQLDRVKAFLETELKDRIRVRHVREHATSKQKMIRDVEIYVLDMPVMIYVETDHFVQVLYTPEHESFARELLSKAMQFKRRKERTTKISMVVSGVGGLDTTDLEIRKPKLDFDLHYNADLKPVHDTIIGFLRKKQQSGLVLLHGEPGTGKSTYIRYLIRSAEKKVIFLPPGLAASLEAPAFTSFLIENANSVLVIEDAENLITSRESGGNSAISMILNLTDGLLGESLGIQIVATFNTDLRRIDKALLRKGRLVALYEFKKLEKERTARLMVSLGHPEPTVLQPLSLAEIFNHQQPDLKVDSPRTQIGFMATAV